MMMMVKYTAYLLFFISLNQIQTIVCRSANQDSNLYSKRPNHPSKIENSVNTRTGSNAGNKKIPHQYNAPVKYFLSIIQIFQLKIILENK